MEKFNYRSVSEFVGMDFNAYLITITKDIAEEMLSASIGNRKLNRNNVNALVRDMNNNDYHYKTPGSGIAFNTAGQLVNGHHTLAAFKESNLNVITLMLLTGAEHLDKCDTGKTRTLADSAIMSGNADYKDISKTVVNIFRIKNNIPPSNTGHKKEFSLSEIFTFCENNFNELSKLNNDLKAYKNKIRKKNMGIGAYPKSEDSVLTSLMWELIYDEGYNPELVTDFAYGIITANTHPNAVVDKFRLKVISDARRSNKNGAMTFNEFRIAFKDNFYKFAKSLTKTAA